MLRRVSIVVSPSPNLAGSPLSVSAVVSARKEDGQREVTVGIKSLENRAQTPSLRLSHT